MREDMEDRFIPYEEWSDAMRQAVDEESKASEKLDELRLARARIFQAAWQDRRYPRT